MQNEGDSPVRLDVHWILASKTGQAVAMLAIIVAIVIVAIVIVITDAFSHSVHESLHTQIVDAVRAEIFR